MTRLVLPSVLISCLVSPGPGEAWTKKPPVRQLDPQTLKTQVMLDRAGYSPGEIDANMGTSTRRALNAFVEHGGNASALPSDELTTYRITEEDAAGPFTPVIPSNIMEMAKL